MAKKPRKIEGSNLRILAAAYASKRLDRGAYLRLRGRQLSALEFDKPLPELPPDLLDINIPSVKIDAPYRGRPGAGFPTRLLLIVLVVLGLATAAYVGYLRLAGTGEPVSAGQPSLATQAQTLLTSSRWRENDINTFLTLWASRSESAKRQARKTDWFFALENEIIKRINQTKLERNAAENLPAYQERLNRLRRFYAELAAE